MANAVKMLAQNNANGPDAGPITLRLGHGQSPLCASQTTIIHGADAATEAHATRRLSVVQIAELGEVGRANRGGCPR